MARSENKTQPTKRSVKEFLEEIEDEQMRKDCKELSKFMEKLSGEKPVLWGDVIVGFGKYHYKYESGREGDSCLIGFAPRKAGISLYLSSCEAPDPALLRQLGKHAMGKGCLTIKRLADVDVRVLERLIRNSVKAQST